MYFEKFPVMRARLDGKFKPITDIFYRIAPITNIIKNVEAIQTTAVEDGETPEILAYKIYGNEEYHWILLVLNNIVDPREEWPKTSRELYDFCVAKYGEGNIYTTTHHYQTTNARLSLGVPQGLVVDYDAADLANGYIEPRTNWEYEEDVNEEKRQIKYLPKQFLTDFIKEFNRLLPNG